MTALEFAIGQALRNYFFGLRLLLTWAAIIAPLAAAYFFAVLEGKIPDAAALQPAGLAGAAALAAVTLLALLSMTVTWYRRILLDETPRGFLWWRLDRPVWRYLAAKLLVLAILAVFGLAGAIVHFKLKPAFEAAWGPQAGQAAMALLVVPALLAAVAGYKFAAWPAAMAAGAKGFGFRRVRRATNGNTLRFIAHLFWLAFTLVIVGGVAAGGFFASQAFPNPWLSGGAVALAVILGWFAILLLLSVPAALYRHFGQNKLSTGG